LLIIGFGLHNATEGLGIVGPSTQEVPSLRFLGPLGLIGGGRTFLGTLVGYHLVSTLTFIFFLALAAGASIHIIAELFHANRVRGTLSQAPWGILLGPILTYVTELILTTAGV
jgi:ZIP family zinc transporter